MISKFLNLFSNIKIGNYHYDLNKWHRISKEFYVSYARNDGYQYAFVILADSKEQAICKGYDELDKVECIFRYKLHLVEEI